MTEQAIFLDRMLAAMDAGGQRQAFVRHGEVTSFHAARELLLRLHRGLVAAGAGPGDVIAITGGNHPDTILAQLAVQLCGARALQLTTSARVADRADAVRTAGATTLITAPGCDPAETARLANALPGLDVLATSALASGGAAGTPPTGDQAAAIFPTGGTTGTPKLVGHSGIYEGMARIFAPDPAGPRRALLVAPVSHLTGNCAVLGALLCGDTMVLHDGFHAADVLAAIEVERINLLTLTPPRLAEVLDHPDLPTTDTSSLRSLSLGAAPLPAHRMRQAGEAFGPVAGQGYGLTEAPMVAGISAAELAGNPHRLGSVGRIVPGMRARVEEGTGEVLVRGLSLMDGYFNQPERTASAFDGEWLRTGDVGEFDDEGYLYLTGRLDDVLSAGAHGTPVHPGTVERALHSHPGIAQVAVLGEGSALHAVVVEHEPGRLSEADVVKHARANLEREHLVPASVRFVDSLPLTSIGKIDRRLLRRAL